MAQAADQKNLIEDLNGKNSKKRQKAVKYIAKNNIRDFGETLFILLQKLVETEKGFTSSEYYERYEICIALGDLHYSNAADFLNDFARTGNGIDRLGAGISYIRLTRKTNTDYCGIFKYLEQYLQLRSSGVYTSLALAALSVACNDRMIPSTEDQKKLIEYAWNCIDDAEMQNCVPLFASICAGFDASLTKELLYKILEKGIVELSYIKEYAEDALQGKYNKYNPRS